MSCGAFHDRYRQLLDRLPAADRRSLIAETRLLTLPGNVPPWIDSDLRVAKGEEVTWLAEGKVVLSEDLGLWGGPCFHLWGRIGERGEIFKGTRDTFTFRTATDGPLHLATYQGEWGTREGQLATPVEAYAAVTGAIDLLVIRWKGSAAAGLERLSELAPNDPLIAAERRRLSSAIEKPEGWSYLWFLGEGEIFSARRSNGETGIGIHTANDVGILQKRVELDLTPSTEISWRWNVSKLPATEAEDTVPTHDYLSIAVEFDNGLDLTYYWSAALPAGAVFTCPLPTWAPRETHMVVRSGPEGLGSWQREARNVHQDYAKALGDPPKKIVGIWLIAVSLFRHGEGVAEIADIEIRGDGQSLRVL
jgi:DUF3047 family protein